MKWLVPIAVVGAGLGLGVVGAISASRRVRGRRDIRGAGTGLVRRAVQAVGLAPRALVLYAANVRPEAPGDAAVFLRNAELAGSYLGTDPIPIRSAQDVLTALRDAPSGLTRVALIGHGTQDKFFEPQSFGIRTGQRGGDQLPTWVSAGTFGRALAAKAARGVIVSLAGCSAGANPEEYRNPATVTGDGGDHSLAALIRDELQRAGVGGGGGEVRAHTTAGTVLMNPQGRTFKIKAAEVGRPGRHIMNIVWGRDASRTRNPGDWNRYARGAISTRWMLGEDLPT